MTRAISHEIHFSRWCYWDLAYNIGTEREREIENQTGRRGRMACALQVHSISEQDSLSFAVASLPPPYLFLSPCVGNKGRLFRFSSHSIVGRAPWATQLLFAFAFIFLFFIRVFLLCVCAFVLFLFRLFFSCLCDISRLGECFWQWFVFWFLKETPGYSRSERTTNSFERWRNGQICETLVRFSVCLK